MKTLKMSFSFTALTLGVAFTTAAHAQSAPARSTPGLEPAVVTDAAPAPAEERDSAGAVVLDPALQRARRANAFTEAQARTGVASLGSALRATARAKIRAELADARAARDRALRERGAGALEGN